MNLYIRCEFWDKNNNTAYRNIMIYGYNNQPMHMVFNLIEHTYFQNTGNRLIGFMNFKNISSWEWFNEMTEKDIQKWIDIGNVEFYWCRPEQFHIPKGVFVYQRPDFKEYYF